ncbi:MAG: hypothetical protein PHV53_00860 [Fermentimonas sp.]|nr:hypothetical protein [Fermentimonas sp.]
MEKENLYRLIGGESIENISIDQLKSVVDEYPYFQSARLLYTKKLHLTDKEQYGEELSKTAILCADRRKLFYMIYPDDYEKLLNTPDRKLPENMDRTEALLDSYFNSFGKEDVDESPVDTSDLNYATTDYFGYLESLGEESDTESAHEPFQHQDIIDAFINKNESNTIQMRPFDENSSNKKKKVTDASENIDEGNEFLTETLAKIYIKQKKYEQALTIIKRLSLTFPKKSSYFADQIRFLEYLIINEKTNK